MRLCRHTYNIEIITSSESKIQYLLANHQSQPHTSTQVFGDTQQTLDIHLKQTHMYILHTKHTMLTYRLKR